jgi:3-phenylpropionate/trans-cinnamate dioxygenase ferredoxin subunit
MARHVVAPVAEFPPGTRRLIEVDGRGIAVFNVKGKYFALLNRCPHNGGSLIEGVLTGLLESTEPGQYSYSRQGEVIRCPWHGWEFDLETGRSLLEPKRVGLKTYRVTRDGDEVVLHA